MRNSWKAEIRGLVKGNVCQVAKDPPADSKRTEQQKKKTERRLPATRARRTQPQQRAARSRRCGIMKTSEEVTGSLEGMRRGGAPLLSCYLCELSRLLHIYSGEARRGAALSLLQPRDRCHLQAKRASPELNTKLSGALTSCL